MAKKHKCLNCAHRMSWAYPHKVNEENYEYAVNCLRVLKRSFICDMTMKNKCVSNEQYCKYYSYDDYSARRLENDIKELEKAIADYGVYNENK